MKIKKCKAVILIMMLMLLAAGCTDSEKDSGINESFESEKATEPNMKIEMLQEETVEEESYVHHVEDEDGIYLMISPETTVYSFKFVAVQAEDTKSGVQYSISEELYVIDKLTTDKPFLVKMQFVGMLPTYGIVFEDSQHNEKFYTINMKGTDAAESYPYYLYEVK